MKVIRNINNNVAVCLDDNNHELIAFGKGIGFKKAPYEISLSQIDRTYYNLDSHYISLLNEIPEEVLDVSLEIVKKGSSYLNTDLSRVFLFSLSDHINFAIQNWKKGLILSNPMTNEIRHLYEKEILLGKWAVKYIDKRLHVRLPVSEEANIAMHFINAKQEARKDDDRDEFEHFVDDITDIVESEMDIIVDRSSFSYSRFVTHLKYLLKRTSQMALPLSDNIKMYEDVNRKYPELRIVIEKIKQYIMSELNIEPSKEELLYLMIHINRLCAKEGL
ncbi:MAG: PRD domain-containing protein [Floccifex sp.]